MPHVLLGSGSAWRMRLECAPAKREAPPLIGSVRGLNARFLLGGGNGVVLSPSPQQ